MNPDDLKLKAQTVLNQKLVEQGEKDRLKDLLRSRLIECGWRDRMKLLCREKIQKTGVDNVTVDSLIGEITKEARASIPDSVKRELLDKIKAFLIEQTSSQ